MVPPSNFIDILLFAILYLKNGDFPDPLSDNFDHPCECLAHSGERLDIHDEFPGLFSGYYIHTHGLLCDFSDHPCAYPDYPVDNKISNM